MLTPETHRGYSIDFDPLSIPGNELRGWHAAPMDCDLGPVLFGPTRADVIRQVDAHLSASRTVGREIRNIVTGLAMGIIIGAAIFGPMALADGGGPSTRASGQWAWSGGVIRPMPRPAPTIRSSRPLPNPARYDAVGWDGTYSYSCGCFPNSGN